MHLRHFKHVNTLLHCEIGGLLIMLRASPPSLLSCGVPEVAVQCFFNEMFLDNRFYSFFTTLKGGVKSKCHQ